MKDQFYLEQKQSVSENRKLILYQRFKTKFSIKSHLDILKIRKFSSSFASFRISCHSLEIERGRHYNIERDERTCRVCGDIIEDEYHFLLICPYYKDIRDPYLPTNYVLNPNLHKFNILMSNITEIVIRRLPLFYIMHLRNVNHCIQAEVTMLHT